MAKITRPSERTGAVLISIGVATHPPKPSRATARKCRAPDLLAIVPHCDARVAGIVVPYAGAGETESLCGFPMITDCGNVALAINSARTQRHPCPSETFIIRHASHELPTTVLQGPNSAPVATTGTGVPLDSGRHLIGRSAADATYCPWSLEALQLDRLKFIQVVIVYMEIR